MSKAEWRLGLGGSDHDFSAALMFGHDLRVVIEQERITRVKNGLSLWYREPMAPAINYCLDAENIVLDEVGVVAASDTIPARTRAAFTDGRLRLFSHHLCHAASAYMMLPSRCRAAIVVYDGYGSIVGSDENGRPRRETVSFYTFGPEGLRRLGTTTGLSYQEQDDFPVGISNSVGMLYEVATQILGYGALSGGKTMGLAAHGAPLNVAALMDFVSFHEDPSDCFRCPTDRSEIADCMEAILIAGGGGFAAKADLAASLQAIVEAALTHFVSLLPRDGIDYVALSGGCALNTVANARIATASRIPVFIPPHCSDAGLGLGALWLAAQEDGCSAPPLSFRGAALSPSLSRPGRLYSDDEIREAARSFYPRLVLDPSVTSAADLAPHVAAGDVVGVFNGRSEIGPRALGGRSILADPRRVVTRERINRVLKAREPFRPLAPIILAAHYDDYFEDRRCADPFMLKVAESRERCRREAPAVLHVDGTARIQVVDLQTDPWVFDLLTAFKDVTGVPILVNTSFNRRGEPIVETPEDAFDAFLGMELDGLYLDGRFYRRA